MIYDDDAFCFYCQKQYASPARLVTHIRRMHPGTYAYYSVAGGDDPEPTSVKQVARNRTRSRIKKQEQEHST